MLVDLSDGACRECGGQLEIVDADDCTMDVQCNEDECGEAYTVEPGAFGDGCVTYVRCVSRSGIPPPGWRYLDVVSGPTSLPGGETSRGQ